MLRVFLTVLLMMLPFNFINASPLKVGLVLDKGGKDDKSFNASAYEGAIKAQKDFQIDLKFVEATDTNAIENLHRSFARKKFDLIIGVGFAQQEAVRKVAAQFPQVSFALVDGEVNASNVRSLLFEEHEASFLVGALAAMKTKTQTIGFIGGMDIPLIRRFALGYTAGAQYIQPKIKVIENYVGITGEAWSNPAKAKELAIAQYAKNADIIYAGAGASNTGVFDAAEEKKKLAIGCDSNQNWIKPGFILTSMMKSVNVAVYDTIKDFKDGKFTGGVQRFGLANKGVDYAMDENNKSLVSESDKAKLESIRKDIISGKIKVPDYYKKK